MKNSEVWARPIKDFDGHVETNKGIFERRFQYQGNLTDFKAGTFKKPSITDLLP